MGSAYVCCKEKEKEKKWAAHNRAIDKAMAEKQRQKWWDSKQSERERSRSPVKEFENKPDVTGRKWL